MIIANFAFFGVYMEDLAFFRIILPFHIAFAIPSVLCSTVCPCET
ncbi:unnamed protein product [Moneuplotes crassus]|uniref:Uncharacterized protein n=1 Tax=Euplotes crassus TaxID=5936 RepID=A0AAD2D7L3_EUPCR|nr:unnamed protein product [Moneuplotes crassus]